MWPACGRGGGTWLSTGLVVFLVLIVLGLCLGGTRAHAEGWYLSATGEPLCAGLPRE